MKLSSTALSVRPRCAGITLTEVLISLAITSVTTAIMVSSYVLSARAADWIAHSSAAEIAAQARVEQTRVAKWDTQATPVVDELVSPNFPPSAVQLSVPVAGGTPVHGTNFTVISVVSEDPPMRMVRVDCVWSYPNRGLFTNSVTVYRSPDQ